MNAFYQRMLCAKFGWNWLSASSEEVEQCEKLTGRLTDTWWNGIKKKSMSTCNWCELKRKGSLKHYHFYSHVHVLKFALSRVHIICLILILCRLEHTYYLKVEFLQHKLLAASLVYIYMTHDCWIYLYVCLVRIKIWQ